MAKFQHWLILLLCSPSLLFALPEDREQIAILAADRADLNQQTHRGEYLGHVLFDQGSSHLRASRAITEGNAQNKLILAIAFGDNKAQAHFWTETAKNKPSLHAYGDVLRYYPLRHLLELEGHALVKQGSNSFASHKIRYDTQKQHVLSKGGGNLKRTTIIIHPEKKT